MERKKDIDERAIVASFLQDEPADHESLMSGSGEGKGAPTHLKDDRGRGRRRGSEYEGLFIRETGITARSGKMVYIRRDFHDTIQSICHIIGGGDVSLSGYIDNVLSHHFDTYYDEITRLYNERHKGIQITKNTEK